MLVGYRHGVQGWFRSHVHDDRFIDCEFAGFVSCVAHVI